MYLYTYRSTDRYPRMCMCADHILYVIRNILRLHDKVSLTVGPGTSWNLQAGHSQDGKHMLPSGNLT